MTIIEQLYAIVKNLPQEQASEILTFAEFIRAQHLNAQESIAILDTSTPWFEVIAAAYRFRLGEEIGSENLYGWLKVFDKDELSELIAEIEKDYRLVGAEPAAWDRIEATIYEWHESAIALSSRELAVAFSDEIDEVLLTQPTAENTTESVPV